MKESLTTSFFIGAILVASYIIAALPGYFFYYNKKSHDHHYDSNIATLLIPFFLYIGLYFIEDRQGFFVPPTLFIIGVFVSFYFVISSFFPRLDGHPLAVTCLIAGVLACWIFIPESKMRMM